MARNKIIMRRRTTLAQRVPNELADSVTSYISWIRHLRNTYNYRAKCIAAMDETGLQLDMPGGTTLETQGTKSVGITTGHEKDHFTVVLCARADGSKLHPFVVFKGKRKDKSLEKFTGVVIKMQENAWMMEKLTLRWLRMLWGGVAATREKRMLVWDVFIAHKTKRVKVCTQDVCNTDLVFVPPGCTSLLQAPDICWNKPFKAKYSELYDQWCISGLMTYTPARNMRSPFKAQCVEWVKIASLSQETVLRSFKCAAVTTAVDGHKDLLLTCLAENEDLLGKFNRSCTVKAKQTSSQQKIRGAFVLSIPIIHYR